MHLHNLRIALGKSTTHIEEPLGSDGLPDYLAALNDCARLDASPQNNSAVLLISAFGPKTVPQGIRNAYFDHLGTTAPQNNGAYFVHSDEMIERWIRGSVQMPDPDDDDILRGQFLLAGEQPWSPVEYPMIAQWLSLNEGALALIVESSNCPRFYEPIIASNRGTALFSPKLPLASCINEIKSALQARAMLRLKERRLDSAWDDLLACHRLLRRTAAEPSGQYSLIARSEEIEICQAELKLLHVARPDATQLQSMGNLWKDLPVMAGLREQIDTGARFRFLHAVCLLEQGGAAAISQLSSEASIATDDSSLEQAIADPQLDWNELLRLGNEWFDRLMRTCDIADRQKREIQLEQARTELERLSADDTPSSLRRNLSGRTSATRAFAALVQLCHADLSGKLEAFDHEAVQSTFVQIGLALAGYRAEHGQYPERLEQLVPKFLSAVPVDLYAAHAPVQYRLDENGYMLYSIGPNGQDEEGGNSDMFPDADDISVVVSDSAPTFTARDSP